VRQSGGRWVEIHDKEAHWFDSLHEVTPGYVELKDPRRGVELRVFADRVELKSARQDWARVGEGAWAPPAALPSYAQRALPPPQAGPLLRNHLVQALVFDGEQTVNVPVPAELHKAAADFTIEAWIRWDQAQPAGTILATDDGSLVLNSEPLSRGSDGTVGSLRLNWLAGRDLWFVVPNRWTHIALQASGKNWQLFVDGKLVGSGNNAPDRLAATFLLLGAKQGGLCGIIRDFRISRGQLYQANFTPPLKFTASEQALALLEMKASAGKAVKNLAPQGPDAIRDGAHWIPMNNEGQLAAERPDGSVDLIQAFAVLGDPLEGNDVMKWPAKVEAGQPGQPGQRTRMLIPFSPPAEYDVAVEITRLAGEGGAFLGLSIAGRPAILVIDGFPELGGRTGILPQELRQVANAGFMPDVPPMLQTGTAAQFMVRVRRQGADEFSLSLSRPGAKGMTFKGKISDLRVPPEFQIPLQHGMSFGAMDARVRFTDFVLYGSSSSSPSTPLNGSGNPPIAGAPPVSPAPPPPPVARRQPVPTADELATKIAEAREIYQAELKQATKPAQKVTLAGNIFKAGEGTQTDQAARYVLFDLARKVYIQAGEVDDALRAARQMEREYEIPANDMLAATITALNEALVVAEQRAALAKAAADLADELIAAGQFERADAQATIAMQSAARQKDPDLKKEMQQRRAQVARIVKEHATIKPHLETLAARPDDPAANLAAGKFHCLVLEDWPLGLPQLAASADSVYAGPAKLDLEAGGDPAKQLQAAEAWLQVVETDRTGDREDKLALQRRAKALLKSPAAVLTGLDQVKAQKRLETLKDVPPGRKIKTASSPTSPAIAAAPVGAVSFVKQVAPILNARCGGCHVRNARGMFSMATYESLMKGPPAGKVVFPSNVDGSDLIVKVRDKEMPPNGAGIPGADLAILTKWVEEGAKFDGPDPAAPLVSLIRAGTGQPAAPAGGSPRFEGLLLGRATGGGSDAGLSLSYQLGYMLTDADIDRLKAAIGSNNSVQVIFTGNLVLESDQELAVLHSRDAGTVGMNMVYIGSQRVSSAGSGGPAQENKTVMLRRGTHLVRWLLSGELSPGGLLITPANKPAAGAPPAFTLSPDQAMKDLTLRLPTRQSLTFGEGQ
jgi:hypothetical protein